MGSTKIFQYPGDPEPNITTLMAKRSYGNTQYFEQIWITLAEKINVT